ncbi:MAG: peptide deformylase [Nitrospinota bacterium]|nr:peptide deformylase [Nitrospinota bacterium]
MPVLEIAKLGHPILRKKARPVDLKELKAQGDNKLQRLIDDMIETMRDEGGVGIAAPQVAESLQVIIVEYRQNERYPSQDDIPLTVYVNPVITHSSKETGSFWEGCLSLKDLRGLVTRPREVTVEAFSRDGEKMVVEARGFLAVVLQHEIDHLHGKVFLDRMTDLTQLAWVEEWETYWAEKEPADAPESI